MHRLLEIAVHTVPLYYQTIFVSEIVFEGANQPLKSAFTRSSHPNAPLFDTRNGFSRHRLGMIGQVWRIESQPDQERRDSALNNLGFLLAG